MDNDKVYTYSEAAKYLKITEPMVRALVAKGQLRPLRLGYRTVRITQAALDQLLAGGAAGE